MEGTMTKGIGKSKTQKSFLQEKIEEIYKEFDDFRSKKAFKSYFGTGEIASYEISQFSKIAHINNRNKSFIYFLCDVFSEVEMHDKYFDIYGEDVQGLGVDIEKIIEDNSSHKIDLSSFSKTITFLISNFTKNTADEFLYELFDFIFKNRPRETQGAKLLYPYELTNLGLIFRLNLVSYISWCLFWRASMCLSKMFDVIFVTEDTRLKEWKKWNESYLRYKKDLEIELWQMKNPYEILKVVLEYATRDHNNDRENHRMIHSIGSRSSRIHFVNYISYISESITNRSLDTREINAMLVAHLEEITEIMDILSHWIRFFKLNDRNPETVNQGF